MNANKVAVYEVDRRYIHMALGDLAEYIAALGAEFADIGRANVTGHLPPLRSHAYRRAAALLSLYRSRVDFLWHRDIDSATESLVDRFKNRPMPIGHDPSAVH